MLTYLAIRKNIIPRDNLQNPHGGWTMGIGQLHCGTRGFMASSSMSTDPSIGLVDKIS